MSFFIDHLLTIKHFFVSHSTGSSEVLHHTVNTLNIGTAKIITLVVLKGEQFFYNAEMRLNAAEMANSAASNQSTPFGLPCLLRTVSPNA